MEYEVKKLSGDFVIISNGFLYDFENDVFSVWVSEVIEIVEKKLYFVGF